MGGNGHHAGLDLKTKFARKWCHAFWTSTPWEILPEIPKRPPGHWQFDRAQPCDCSKGWSIFPVVRKARVSRKSDSKSHWFESRRWKFFVAESLLKNSHGTLILSCSWSVCRTIRRWTWINKAKRALWLAKSYYKNSPVAPWGQYSAEEASRIFFPFTLTVKGTYDWTPKKTVALACPQQQSSRLRRVQTGARSEYN